MRMRDTKAYQVVLTESEAKALKAAVRKCLGRDVSVYTPEWERLYAEMEEVIQDDR